MNEREKCGVWNDKLLISWGVSEGVQVNWGFAVLFSSVLLLDPSGPNLTKPII